MAQGEIYKDYNIQIAEVSTGKWVATITRLDGGKINVNASCSGEASSLTTFERFSREDVLKEARTMIDGGGMQ